MDLKQVIIAVAVIVVVAGIGGFLYISGNSTNTLIGIECNGTLQNGDTINITLRDEFRNPLPEESVDFKILDETGSSTKAVLTTDSSGSASYTLQGMENGNYTVHCAYNGTLFHHQTRNMANMIIDDGY